MNARVFALSSLFVLAASAAGLVACSADDEPTEGESEEDVVRRKAGALGATCSDTKKCQTGLVCKTKSSGPPPGAVGLPQPPSTTSSGGPPPGAVGLPQPPPPKTCQKPSPGEEGGTCNDFVPCNPGLECVRHASSSGGPPPGAVGLPQPPSTTSSGGPPPGAVGLPQPAPDGTCKKASSGPPPGAVGLPQPPP